MVLNKFHQHPFSIDRLALREKYPFVEGFVETDCKLKAGESQALGFEQLRGLIASTVGAMPMVSQRFKKSWWNIKNALQKAHRNHSYLPYTIFQEICARHGESDAQSQRYLADVFHALGVALNYGRDERLRDATVLNPRWVTEGIYKMLREGVPDDGTALLTMQAVQRVLHDDPPEMQRYLVALMRRFDLAFPLNEEADRWLVPQRLPGEQPPLDR